MKNGFNARTLNYGEHKACLDQVTNRVQLLLWLRDYARYDLGPHQAAENRDVLGRIGGFAFADEENPEVTALCAQSLERVTGEMASSQKIDLQCLNRDLDRVTAMNLNETAKSGPGLARP